MEKEIVNQVQKAQRAPYRINPRRNIPRHILINLLLLLLSRFSRVQLCDPMDCSLPGSAVPGILQARTMEWLAIAFSVNNNWSGLPLPSPSTIRYHLTMVEWLSSKSPQIINAREGVEKWKHSYNTGGNVNWKTVWRFLKKKP